MPRARAVLCATVRELSNGVLRRHRFGALGTLRCIYNLQTVSHGDGCSRRRKA